MVIASKEWTSQKMIKSKSSPRLPLTLLVKLQLWEISIDSMFSITIQRDLSGMKSVANKLRITIQ